MAVCSTYSECGLVYMFASWAMATNRPSRPAPKRTRWLNVAREPTRWKICCRVITTLTGWFNRRAAGAARIGSEWMASLEPNPPPTLRDDNTDPPWVDPERARDRSTGVVDDLGADVDRQIVAIPDRQTRARLHRLGELIRRRVAPID